MIVSILEPRDLRRPRLAFAIAQVRRRQCRSLGLLDATAPSSSQWRNQQIATLADMPGLAVVSAAGRGLQPVLDTLGSRCRDIVIDIDEIESFAARSALVAAKVLVVAMTSADWDDSGLRLALRDRIERVHLFNPTLKVLLVPVGSSGTLASGQHDMLRRIAESIPSARVVDSSVDNLGRLRTLSQGKFDADMERDMVALCAELFPDLQRPMRFLPAILYGQRRQAEKTAALEPRVTPTFQQRWRLH